MRFTKPLISNCKETCTLILLSCIIPIFAQNSLPEASPPSSFYWVYRADKEKVDMLISCEETSKPSASHRSVELSDQRFWEAGPPFYPWKRLMSTLSDTYPQDRNGGRMVHFFAGIHDAIQRIYVHLPDSCRQPIRQLPKSQHLSYQMALIASAETASRMLTFYFPRGQAEINQLYQKHRDFIHSLAIDSSLHLMGIKISEQVAQQLIERAKNDRTRSNEKVKFIDRESGLWYGTPSVKDYAKRQWRPFVLDTPSEFRCPPPPTSWEEDMEELRQFNQTHTHSDIAWKWKSIPVWDQWLDQLMFEYQIHLNPLQAAFIYATFHITRYEATLSAWEAKYHYMGIRPFQYDTSFQPLLVHTPNFPGYPAGHTTVAGALAAVISHFFPEEKTDAIELAKECAESRFEGGVHFRTDNEVGLQQGKRVGQAVLQHISP
ncbi:MAG: phosphatase PAP2 family protein [Bacteroidetes bacterium]|jgi:hypothetical protein|nr:phosphatase PAP2 family protein [Bacteroidota bacterium]